MKNQIFIFLTATLIAGCGNSYQELAKKEVELKLSDPLSAQYRNIKSYSYGVVCGEVNSKNKFGGYGGFEKLIYFGFGDDIVVGYKPEVVLPANSDDLALWCTNEKDKYILTIKHELVYFRDKCALSRYNTKNCVDEYEKLKKELQDERAAKK